MSIVCANVQCHKTSTSTRAAILVFGCSVWKIKRHKGFVFFFDLYTIKFRFNLDTQLVFWPLMCKAIKFHYISLEGFFLVKRIFIRCLRSSSAFTKMILTWFQTHFHQTQAYTRKMEKKSIKFEKSSNRKNHKKYIQTSKTTNDCCDGIFPR